MADEVQTTIATVLAAHDSLRRDLTRIVGALTVLGEGDTVDGDALAGVRAYWADFEGWLGAHHRMEDVELYPKMAVELGTNVDSMLGAMNAEHEELVRALATTSGLVARLGTEGAAAAAAEGAGAAARLERLMLGHLEHEEADCIPLMASALDPEFCAGFVTRMQAQISPAQFLPWLLDDAGPATVARVTAPLPEPVRQLLVGQWQPARQALVDALPAVA
jgi:hemerythrin-like domain-containing protein